MNTAFECEDSKRFLRSRGFHLPLAVAPDRWSAIMLAKLTAFLRNQRTRVQSPYFAEFLLAPRAVVPPGVNVANYPGLVLFHVVHHPILGARVLTYWLAQAHCAYSLDRLATDAGGQTNEGGGTVVEVRMCTTPVWRRITVYTWLLALVGFLTAVKGLAEHYDWLFSSPDLVLAAGAHEPINLVEGIAADGKIALFNRLSTGQTDIRVEAYLISPGAVNHGLKVPDAVIPGIHAGGTHSVLVPLQLRRLGEHGLRLVASAKAGWFIPRRSKTFNLPIVVWPSHPVVRVTTTSAAATTGVLHLTLRTGIALPQGVECALDIVKMAGLRFDGSDGKWAVDGPPGAEVARLEFSKSLPVGAFAVAQYSFSFQSGHIVDWNKVASNATVHCSRLEGNG